MSKNIQKMAIKGQKKYKDITDEEEINEFD